MYYTWRTDTDGRIWRRMGDGPEECPMLGGDGGRHCEAGISRWSDSFRAWGMGVRWEWLIAMAYQESGFDPAARNKEGTPDPDNDGVGLFQITHPSLKGRKLLAGLDGIKRWVGGYTDVQLMDPQLNTTIACRYILELTRKYGPDFPKVSAAYNAGSVRPPSDAAHENPWGMHMTAGHAESEVRCLNYVISRGLPAGRDVAPLFSLREILTEKDLG